MLLADGVFHAGGAFTVAPAPDGKQIAESFRHRVLKMLLVRGKITSERIALMDNWRHTGFNVYVGPRIPPWHRLSTENLARYIIRASFSQERMSYDRKAAEVVYRSKGGAKVKVFDALEWLAAMCSHVPNKGEQMVRYYGYYSNVAWGKRRRADSDDVIPCVLEPELTDRNFRRTWARLIQKIYEVDTLVCPKCAGPMRVIAFIEQANVLRKILEHLGLWGSRHKPVPRANAPPVLHVAEDVDAYLPTSDDDMVDPSYPVDAYF